MLGFFKIKKKEAIPACMTIVRTATCNIISPNPSMLTVRTLRFPLKGKRKKETKV